MDITKWITRTILDKFGDTIDESDLLVKEYDDDSEIYNYLSSI